MIAAMAAQLEEIREMTAPPVVVISAYQNDDPAEIEERAQRADRRGTLVVVVRRERERPVMP